MTLGSASSQPAGDTSSAGADTSFDIDHLLALAGGNDELVRGIRALEHRVRHRVAALEMLTSVSSMLLALPPEELDNGVVEALRMISDTAASDRTLLALFTDVPDEFKMWHVWVRTTGKEVLPSPAEELRSPIVPWVCARLRAGETIVIATPDAMPPEADEERRLMQMLGTKSLLVAPLHRGDMVIGGLALSVYDAPQSWTEDTISFLRLATDLLSGVITRREQSKATLLEQERLRYAVEALAVTTRVKDDFLSTVSHELRTPLTSILGMAELLLLQAHGFNEKQLRFLHVISENGKRLLGLIEDIFDVADLEAGELQLSMAAVAVAPAAQAALRVVRLYAQQKQIALASVIDPDDLAVLGDEKRLRQMLVNLLTNAVKFTPDHGRVHVQACIDQDPAFARIDVVDTGIGIVADDIPRLFTPFSRLDEALTRRTGGAGLGLAITRRLVEMHGGTITLESTPGLGSTFTLRLPRARTGDSPQD